MALGKNANKEYLTALAGMKNVDYSKAPEIGQLYARLSNGRKQLGEVMTKDLSAVMQISSLDVALLHYTDQMGQISASLAESSDRIVQEASESARVAGEVSNQHEELTNTILTASEETSAIYQNIEAGQKELTNIKDLSEKTISESKELKENMENLADVINNMNEVIDGINSISGQTNLLALNASIEAARAGEAGKGFAVVAEEIRKLAEQTQTMTANMGEFVERVKEASAKSANSANAAVEALGNMGEKITSVWGINDQNQKSAGKISDSVSSLAAVSQEISSSMDEMANQSLNIQKQCEQQQEEAQKLLTIGADLKDASAPLQAVEKEIDDAAKMMGQMGQDVFYTLDNRVFTEQINKAIGAHQTWLSNLKSMIDRQEVIPVQVDDAKCGFGHFYNSVTPQNPEVRKIWSTIQEKHRKFHQFGKEAVDAVFREDYTKAKDVYRQAEEFSKGLVADLQQLERVVEGLTAQGLSF